jgi:tetratricopeptide (TPR) repeat protein
MLKLRNPAKATYAVVLFFLLIYLEGCSTFNQTWSYLKFWEKKESSYQFSDKEIGQFAAKIRIHKNNPESHYLLGCYYQQKGRHREAIREFDKAILINPGDARAYNGRGVSYDRLRDFQDAVRSYNMALKIAPNLDYVHNNLGYSYFLQGNYNAAIISFKNALAINDKSNRTSNNLGLAYAMNGQFDQALKQFEQSGDKAQAHYNLAGIYYEKGLFEEAKKEYREVLNLNPDFPRARNGLEAADALARIIMANSESRDNGDNTTAKDLNSRTEAESDPIIRKAGIEVSNGNGTRYMAREIGQYLRIMGFNVVRLTNADHFNYPEGSIMCRKGYCELAQEILVWLPNIKYIRETTTFDRDDVKIRVLVGKKQVKYKSIITARRGET